MQADVGATITVTVSWTDLGGTSESLTSTPTAAVANVNDLPVASAIEKTTDEDTALTFAASDFTDAFSDPDGHTLKSVKLVTLPTAAQGGAEGRHIGCGRESGGSGGQPQHDLVRAGSELQRPGSFTYKVTDSSGEESAAAAATVTVTVSAVNDLPVASAIEKTTDEDTALTFAASDLHGCVRRCGQSRAEVGEAGDAADGGAGGAEGRHIGCDGGSGGSGGQPQHDLVRAGGELQTARPASPTRRPTPRTRSLRRRRR